MYPEHEAGDTVSPIPRLLKCLSFAVKAHPLGYKACCSVCAASFSSKWVLIGRSFAVLGVTMGLAVGSMLLVVQVLEARPGVAQSTAPISSIHSQARKIN